MFIPDKTTIPRKYENPMLIWYLYNKCGWLVGTTSSSVYPVDRNDYVVLSIPSTSKRQRRPQYIQYIETTTSSLVYSAHRNDNVVLCILSTSKFACVLRGLYPLVNWVRTCTQLLKNIVTWNDTRGLLELETGLSWNKTCYIWTCITHLKYIIHNCRTHGNLPTYTFLIKNTEGRNINSISKPE